MHVPVWLLVALVAAVVLLVLALWSARAQRSTRVHLGSFERFPDLLTSISALTNGWFVEGNAVRLLQNGEEFFPALLDAIHEAEDSIHLESYVWWKGDICFDVSAALAKKAKAGVEVRVLLDALGSMPADSKCMDDMEAAGVRLVKYHPVELRALGRLNQRTHRKLLVVDGRVAFVFSHGFAHQWMGCGDGPENWRDTGARLEGPIVGHVQAVFAQNWMEETAEVIFGERYFPELSAAGDVRCQIVASRPSGGASSVSVLHKLMIAAADHELLIQNPYFCPDHDMVRMLTEAAGRGVTVRVMVPGPVCDSRSVLHAGHFQFSKLLAAGVEIYEHQVTLIHQKVLVVDDLWSHLGSTNFDERSFDINAEISLGMLDAGVAERLSAAFEDDLRSCRRLDLASWRRRGLVHRVLDAAAFLVHEQL
ncbi:MAG TPA: phospholipase D-like domain-containing protein [Thermoanaerobaculia bacterium]|nr:phospholipase D-like domain-containing protein [Thermoanaerobaculia bacterium]